MMKGKAGDCQPAGNVAGGSCRQARRQACWCRSAVGQRKPVGWAGTGFGSFGEHGCGRGSGVD